MQWINGLNSNLPNDISVVDLDKVKTHFIQDLMQLIEHTLI